MTMVSFGLGLGEDIAYYKIDYKIQDIFVASPISQFAYMMGMALSELLFGLPVMIILFFIALHFGAHITDGFVEIISGKKNRLGRSIDK